MQEPLGYNVYDSTLSQWWTGIGWSVSFHDADEIDSLEKANDIAAEQATKIDGTLYVFAVMPLP